MKTKSLLVLAASSLVFLTGCQSVTRLIRGNDYIDSSLAQSSSLAANAAFAQEIEEALKADATAFPQLSTKVAKDQAQVILKTSEGDIDIKLFPKQAPLAVENFLTHAKEGYYDGLTFHRVIQDFMIQTGDPNGDGTGGQSVWAGKDDSKDAGYGFVNEPSAYLYNIRGALAMANAGQDTNGSQFYIVQNSRDWSAQLSDDRYPQAIQEAYKNGGYPSLDGGYTVFGQVISGMDIVDKIAAVETGSADKPVKDITIKSIEIVQDYDFSK